MTSDENKAVFLSYASQDAEAALRLCSGLRAADVEVWFDQSELRGGDVWDAKIRKQIRECALFVPVISTNTQQRLEGYFRLEWKLAEDRSHLIARSKAFIVPVVIDGTSERDAHVPEAFLGVQWVRLGGNNVPPAFTGQIKALLAAASTIPKNEISSRSQPVPATGTQTASRNRHRRGLVTAAVAGLAVLTGSAWYWSSHSLNRPTPAPAAVSAAEPISIAVLAFDDLSEDRNSGVFADGVSEELANALGKVEGLRVMAPNSALSFKGRGATISQVAQELKVGYLVTGSVRKSGSRSRISARLVKASDGFQLWTDNFDRELKDVIAVQDEIAGLIARQLRLRLTGVSTGAKMVNPEAFELYLQGRQAWNERTMDSFNRAEILFKRALEIDPNFARAHAGLADVWLIRGQDTLSETDGEIEVGPFGHRNSSLLARVMAKAEEAAALDPASAEAHASLANAYQYQWKFPEALREYRRAVELNPSYASGHQWLGRALVVGGAMEEGLAELKLATGLDPFSSRIWDNYSSCLLNAGRPIDALAAAERALALRPASQATVAKARALSSLGRHDEAVALVRGVPARATLAGRIARVFAEAGDADQARRTLIGSPPAGRVIALFALRENEEGLTMLDALAVTIGDLEMQLFDPVLDPVRGDPRFKSMLSAVGLTEAHDRAQAWRAAHPPTN